MHHCPHALMNESCIAVTMHAWVVSFMDEPPKWYHVKQWHEPFTIPTWTTCSHVQPRLSTLVDKVQIPKPASRLTGEIPQLEDHLLLALRDGPCALHTKDPVLLPQHCKKQSWNMHGFKNGTSKLLNKHGTQVQADWQTWHTPPNSNPRFLVVRRKKPMSLDLLAPSVPRNRIHSLRRFDPQCLYLQIVFSARGPMPPSTNGAIHATSARDTMGWVAMSTTVDGVELTFSAWSHCLCREVAVVETACKDNMSAAHGPCYICFPAWMHGCMHEYIYINMVIIICLLPCMDACMTWPPIPTCPRCMKLM